MRFNDQDDHNIKRLKDTSKNGKERPWREKFIRKTLMSEHLQHAGDKYEEPHLYKKAERMEQCARILTFKQTPEGLKLYQAYLCKGRLCSVCNWRRSLKIAWQNKQIVEKANQDHKLRWLFLTLTVQNCEASELKQTVDQMMKAWNRFTGYKRVKQAVRGYFRALEITKNRNFRSQWNGTYHPHFHALLCVPTNYFGKLYIKQADWRQMWKKAMKIDYDPIVDVRPVKPKKEEPDLERIEDEIREAVREQKAIQEVSKYPVKDTDILPFDQLTEDGIETVYTLDNAMAYKRLISYGGILKGIRAELQLDDPEDGDLIRTTDEDPTANAIAEVTAYWHIGIKDYVVSDKKLYQKKGKLVDPDTGEIV